MRADSYEMNLRGIGIVRTLPRLPSFTGTMRAMAPSLSP
jgi:hypothetical protein